MISGLCVNGEDLVWLYWHFTNYLQRENCICIVTRIANIQDVFADSEKKIFVNSFIFILNCTSWFFCPVQILLAFVVCKYHIIPSWAKNKWQKRGYKADYGIESWTLNKREKTNLQVPKWDIWRIEIKKYKIKM